MFKLDPLLAKDTIKISELTLSQLLIIDNCYFPWFILVPKITGIIEIIDLSGDQRNLLYQEIEQIAFRIKEIYKPDKLNIATLGNVISQLHVHIIARYKSDSLWPHAVFGTLNKKSYTQQDIVKIKQQFVF